MNVLRFLVLVGLASPLLSHADIISGSFQVNRPFLVHIQPENDCVPGDRRLGCTGPFDFTLGPGNYNASADIEVNSMFVTLSSTPYSVQFGVTLPASIPDNGSFTLGPAETGQTWGLNGMVTTGESDTAEQQGWEGCSYESRQWVCGPYGCGWENVMINGRRWVSYHDHCYSRVLNMDAFDSQVLGHFSGQSGSQNRIYTQVGNCQ